jgi:hypothetical protein
MDRRRVLALGALIIAATVGGAGAQAPPALFPITVNDRHGMIDRDGKVVIPPEYAEPIVFRDGLARVARGSKVAFHQGLAFVGEPGSRGAYIDPKGRVVWASR